jgi:alpha-L-fucosidase
MRPVFIALLVLLTLPALGQEEKQKYYPETDPLVLDKLEEWQDIKFGLLMHWGTYSQWGIVESWSICAEDVGWCNQNEHYTEYKAEYEALQTTFNPVNFNPDKWAAAAKRAGMKYMVFTTKHHDGFSMFDTQLTDYKITDEKTPFHTDPRANITKEVFDAFRSQDFMIGAYFSKPDWHSEDYWWPRFPTPDRNPNYNLKRYPERWNAFKDFTHGQIDELMTDYGKVDILWLDGGWVRYRSDAEIRESVNAQDYEYMRYQNQDIDMASIAAKARVKQPGLIVVDRAVEGPYQNYITPENRIPEHVIDFPWESPMIAGGSWSWIKQPRYITSHRAIGMLVDIVSKGGNLLLNIAPSPLGEFDEGAYTLLEQIGQWMDVNSEAIYSSRPVAPFKEGKVALTQNRHTKAVYAIYLPASNEDQMPSKMWVTTLRPADDATVEMLGAPGVLDWERVNEGFVVSIPDSVQDAGLPSEAWVLKISSVHSISGN